MPHRQHRFSVLVLRDPRNDAAMRPGRVCPNIPDLRFRQIAGRLAADQVADPDGAARVARGPGAADALLVSDPVAQPVPGITRRGSALGRRARRSKTAATRAPARAAPPLAWSGSSPLHGQAGCLRSEARNETLTVRHICNFRSSVRAFIRRPAPPGLSRSTAHGH